MSGTIQTDKPRYLWLVVRDIITKFKSNNPQLKWVQKLDPWRSLNYKYIESNKQYLLKENNEQQLCRIVYMNQCLVEFKDRVISLIQLCKNQTSFDIKCLILGILRFLEIVNYYHSIFVNNNFQPNFENIILEKLSEKYIKIKQFVKQLIFTTQLTVVQQFQFYVSKTSKFKTIFISEQIIIQNGKYEQSSPSSKTSIDTQVHNLNSKINPLNIQNIKLCQQIINNKQIYTKYQKNNKNILRKQAIQFILIYLLKHNTPKMRQHFRQISQKIIKILQNPTPNTKKFQKLDPRTWKQFSERTQTFYNQILKLYIQIKGFKITSRIKLPQITSFKGYYLTYNQHMKCFQLKFGTVEIYYNGSQRLFSIQQPQSTEDQNNYIKALGQNVEIMIPGFINLHTHTKFNFQGNVDFGSRFSYRFQWRQSQYEGKQVIEDDRIMQNLSKNKTKQQKKKIFKRYAKYYTQLQALIGGTTTIFEQSKYDSKCEFPNIIRKAIIDDPDSENISSNDIYLIWRNQKKKQNLILVWSQDFIDFLESVIQIEVQILKKNERNRINLHVHLAQGKSNSLLTICEFENFCYDIICLQHFVSHLKEYIKLNAIQTQKFQIKCDSKIVGSCGVSIIFAQQITKKFKLSLQIHKFMQISKQNNIKMRVTLYIKQYRVKIINDQIIQTPIKIVKKLQQDDITQIYKLQTLKGNLLLIHANAFDFKNKLHLYLFQAYQIKICISPFSNMTLYGGVKDFNWSKWIFNQKLKKNLCIGTDWNPTGKQNLIQQIRYLIKKLKQSYLIMELNVYINLFEMITINPGKITKMNIGSIKQNYCADFWIGKFNKRFIQKKVQDRAQQLIKFILSEFNYQNDILKVFNNGDLIYSQEQNQRLQEIIVDNEKSKYFYNPQGRQNFTFQNYIKQIRRSMVQDYQKPISLLFP